MVCFSGDGSLLMNIQELDTIAEQQPNLAIILFNNRALGLVRQQQELFFGQKYIASWFQVDTDFTAIAKGFGINAIDLGTTKEPLKALKEALAFEGPVLVNVPLNKSQNVFPMVPPGAGNKTMIG